MNLIKECQFDTIYHEHYSYLSLYFVNNLCRSVGLTVFDVEEISTHGGSLRVWIAHSDSNRLKSENVIQIINKEIDYGLLNLKTYQNFSKRVQLIKNNFLDFLLKKYFLNEKVIGFGAAAKANTLINYAGVKSDLLSCIIDNSKLKINRFTRCSYPCCSDDIPRFIGHSA